jgi:hypothetical protein
MLWTALRSWLKGHEGQQRGRGRRARPGVAALEDRAVRAVLTVNSLVDGPVDLTDAQVTLRDALYAANNHLPVAPGGRAGLRDGGCPRGQGPDELPGQGVR